MDPIRDHSIELRPGMSADELLEALGRNGVTLRLVRDGKVVGVLVRGSEEDDSSPEARSDRELAKRQHGAIDAMLEELAAIPVESVDDELSGRDHDQILYGE